MNTNQSIIARRYSLLCLVVGILFTLGVGNAWANAYYSQFTAKSGNSAQGLVYAAGDNSEGGMSDYTNQVTPEKDESASSLGEEYTWYAWAKAARGYKFKTWTKGSNINSSGSLTSAATTFGVNHSSTADGTISGDATATFEGDTPYTITFKKPENFGAYTAEYENYTISSNKFVEYSKTITMTSSSANTNETSYASDKITLKATARVAYFIGWYNGSTLLSTSADGYTFSPSAAMTVEGRWEEVVTHLNMTFKAVELDDSDNPKGSYTVGGTTVSTSDVVVNTGDLYYLETTLTATPATGYVFTGWYTKDGKKKNFISYDNPFNAYFDQETTVYASFTYSNYSDDQKAQFKVGSTYYTDLNAANTAAVGGSNKTIVCTRDGVLPPGNYTISSGVSLLIPYSTSETVQTTPAVVTTAGALSANRTLTFTDGANVVCNGEICVGGQIMSANGGKPSAYPTGVCGVIDMSKGGHIELNNKAVLYAWGFVKGQDMDQGNNTLEVGTITANSGAVVWEDFAVGDWRGGSACLTIWSNRSSWKFFPFQSYTVQNVEVPTTYKYGSTLSNYTNVYGDGSTNAGKFAIIGKENTLFLLKDSKSLVRKWYDPTTDLVCYEMSGTTQLDALNVDVDITTVNSSDYNLPISSSMHVIMNSNATISKPMVVQAGAVIEVKSGYTLTCSSNVYIFDKDQWGEYCYKKYYYTMTNLTSHKNRGNGTSNELIDDAKLIIDGTLNVTGKMYTTAGGADIMSNGGGKIVFSALPSAANIVMCTGVSDNEDVPVASANLHNEDDSYTKSIASKTFHNVNGRWFNQTDGAAAEKDNHTYDFTYISSGAVSGTGGTSTTTDAVYSWDKTGLELRQKWANVTYSCEGKDENENTHYWWQGQGEQSSWFYNWTLNSDWHQFIPTATTGMYSGSNNKIYTKTDCAWEELGETDVNCLYEIGGVKKALVDGQFIALAPNNNDPAYHAADDASQYYICFEGCNWHEATKYENAEKAYVVDEDIFIWYDGAWMNAEWRDPFFYTLDETNVPIYYEYLNGEWVLSDPYICVIDGLENRTYWFLDEAFAFAAGSLRTSPTIKILRDISGISTAVSYTKANGTCTLDLNGHTITGEVSSMITVNAAGCTFNIEDNTTEKNGKINLVFSANNSRRYALNVKNGHVILKSGTISATCALAYNKTSAPKPLTGCVVVASGKQFTMDGGKVEAISAYNPIAIVGSEGTSTITINDGIINSTAQTIDSPYGIQSYGTINFNGGTINATAEKSSTAVGVYVHASAKAQGTLNMIGGTINATSYAKTSRGVIVNRALAYDTNEPRSITTFYPASANISGGEINAVNTTSTDAQGVYSLGNTTITGGEINAQCSANTTAFGVRVYAGETTISGSAVINAMATSTVYGVRLSEEAPTTAGVVYNSNFQMNGGTINAVATTGGTVYGIYVGGATLANTTTNATNAKSYAGNYASAGIATITGGTVHATAHTTTAYGVFVEAAETQEGAEGYPAATATPQCTINGGYFTADAAAPVAAVKPKDATVLVDNFQIKGGYYSHEDNLETYAVSPKHAVALASDDANYDPYFYKVAEAYTVTFKNGDDVLQDSYQENGKTPIYDGETPTKASTASESYIFDGWSATAGGEVVSPLPTVTGDATYYAHYETTTLKYIVTLDATTNGGSCGTDKIYVNPSTAVGELPIATKAGSTFNGWYTAASGGTKITTATVPTGDVTYYAQFTVNKYTLTWELGDGVVSAVGKYGSTSWPAKKATGTQSKAVSYGLTLTAPTVTRTGYTFHSWAPLVAATMPAEAVTYTAQWTPKTNTAYTVKHYQQNVDGTYPEEPVETEALTGTTGESVTPEVKEYEGFVSPETETKEIAADGTMVIEYKYERMHYTITLDAATNGGTSDQATIEVIHGATIGTVPPDAQKGCNDFTGWYTKPVGGVKITSDFTIEYNLKTLYAQFSDDVRTYPITYNAGANGTGTVAGGTKTCGVNTTLSSSTFTRTDYTQTGWSLTDGGAQAYALGETYTANASLTLYPVWAAVTYNLTYEGLNGATNSNPATYTIETATITLANPGTRAGYAFTGWTCGGSPITQITLGSTGDKTITANWSAVTYNLTYEGLNGATNSNPETYTIETATITLADPGTRAGYTFIGWTCGGSPITQIILGSTGDKVITANWEQIGVTILWKSEDGETTLETDEGVEIDATPSFNGETPTKTTTAEYTYTFDGWTTEANGAGTFYAIGELPAVAAAAAYYAHFTATPNVASVTVGGSTTYYPTIADAWEAVNTAAGAVTLKLLQDVSGVETSLAYTNEQNCTLDLNNHTLSGTVAGNLLDINATGKTFTIDDSSEDKEGILENIKAGGARYYAVFLTAGTLTLEHGTIHSSNPSDASYSSLTTAAKKCMASGVYVTAKQTFNMNGGAVSASAIYYPIGVQTAGVTNLKGGSVTATATKFTTAVGVHSTSTTKIYDGVTITASSTKSTTVYGVQVAGSTTTFYGGTIKAHATSSKGTTVSGIYVSSGKANIPATSTVDVEAKSYGKNCYGVQVAASKTANIYGGSFTATSTNANAAYSVYSLGTTNITGGTFTATAKTSNARGVSVPRGTTTISGDPEFTVRAPNSVYGALASATTPSKAGVSYFGTLIIKGGTFDVEATSTTTAYGVYVGQGTGLSMFSTTNDSVPGNYINAGTAEISGGVFNVTAKTSTAYGVFVNKGTQDKNTTMDAVTASGTCTVTGGKFNVSATSSVGAVNTVAANTDLVIEGGWYNVATNLATKYTAPTKDCNYHVLPLTGEDPYKYEVAEAYTITFKNGDDVLQSTAVKKGTMPVYSGEEPSKAADAQYTYAFTGWDNALVAVTEAATYTATFTQTVNKYTITWVDGNGVTLKTEDLEYGAIPSYTGTTPTKAEDSDNIYTFNGTWSPAIVSVTGDATYTAQFSTTPTVASVTTGGVTTYYTSFKAAFNYAKTATTATLTVLADNNDLDEALTYVPSSSEAVLTIDLNGYSTECISGSNSVLMDINKVGARVIIQDNSASENGILKICKSGNPFGIRVIKGILELQSGTIHAESTNSALYGLIKISNASASFIMSGGKAIGVSNNWTYGIINFGTVTISGGEINLTGVDNTYGLQLKGGTCTISGSPAITTTTGNNAWTVYAEGGTAVINDTPTISATATGQAARAVYALSSGSVTVNGGTFSATAPAGKEAYDIYAESSSTININSGKFTCSSVPVYSNSATLNIYGGYFNEYSGTSSYDNLDAACVAPKHPLTLTSAEKAVVGSDYEYKIVDAYTITFVDGDGNTLQTGYIEDGDTPVYLGSTPTKTADASYIYTFTGWSPAITAATADATYTAQFDAISKEIGDRLDIVDWTATNLTINANGWAASGWPYSINGTAYEKGDRAADRTLSINYSGAAGTELSIKLQDKDENVISLHKYRIPFIGTAADVTSADTIYVNSGTLAINASALTSIGGLYIRPEASVTITGGTLTIGKLVLRTLPWQAAAINGNFTATETWYTRIAPNNRTITGPYAPITYAPSNYYQFGLPLGVSVKVKDIQVSNGEKITYGKAWLVKRYDEAMRAASGFGDNWVALDENEYIQGGAGYEMSSNSPYYREYYFPVGEVSSSSLGTSTQVAYHLAAAGEKHAGWNVVTSPLMGVYDNTKANPESGMKVSWLMTDGSYDQGIPEYIYPAVPFSYQTERTGSVSFSGTSLAVLAPRRRVAAEEEQERIQWIHLDVKDADGIGDHTSVLAHPTRYDETYQTGIDVAKQSFEASRALLYTVHAYGDMAFAGVADSLLERGIPVTVYSPAGQELTFSLRENDWLDRLAEVWLIDNETGTRTDLLRDDYSFLSKAGTTAGRFVIMGRFYAPGVATGIMDAQGGDAQGAKARKVLVDDKMYILINGRTYDATGKLVTNDNNK